MVKKSILLCIAVMFLLLPAICHAKDIPPGRWWRLPYFSEPLNLTDEQKDELDKLFDHNRSRLSELKNQMEQERAELTKLLEEERHLNENAAVVQMKKLENTRTVLSATRFSYSLEVRKLLGHDRFQQLKMLYRSWHGGE